MATANTGSDSKKEEKTEETALVEKPEYGKLYF